MSEHTVRRRVAVFQKTRGDRKGLSSTKPSALKSIIPIFKGPWRELSPGHEQIDTVAHCGRTLLGDFVYSLSAIDSCAYWASVRAQWNKGEEATQRSMSSIKGTLPFPWKEAHPDTGSEFINKDHDPSDGSSAPASRFAELTDRPTSGLALPPPSALAPSSQPDQLRRLERYRFAEWLQKEELDIKPQLKGRMTVRQLEAVSGRLI